MAYKVGCKSNHNRVDIKFIRLLERGKSKSLRFRITFKCGCRVLQNRWIWEQHNGKIPEGYVVHHKDEDTTNDVIENLELKTVKDHLELHGGPIRKTAGIGHKMSEKSKRKTSERMKGNKIWLGRKHSEETKAKIKKANLKERNPNYGKHLSDEQKEHLRQINLGRVSPNKGKKLTKEIKKKISDGLKKNSPNKGKKFNDEHKRKISEGLRRYYNSTGIMDLLNGNSHRESRKNKD